MTTYQKSVSETTGDSALDYMFGGSDEDFSKLNDLRINRIVGGFLIKYSEIDPETQEKVDYELTIKDNKLYSSNAKFEGEVIEETCYKYNNEATAIPGLPEPPDGVWDIV